MNFEEKVKIQTDKYESLIAMKNEKSDFYNGIFDRYKNPVLTRNHVPLFWKYDMNPATNPFFMERLGVNAVMNSGALYIDGKFYLVARVEGADRKSFFAVAESTSGVDGFRFWDYPVQLPDTCAEETNVYDMRLTQHEDGWIYGIFCSERHKVKGLERGSCLCRNCAHKRFKEVGASSELKDIAVSSAKKRCSSS